MSLPAILIRIPSWHWRRQSEVIKELSLWFLMIFIQWQGCMDYVLLTENKGLRKVSMRKFRKMIYADHFDRDYLEYEQKKKELENRIAFLLQAGKYEDAKKVSENLEQLIQNS